LSQEHRTTKTLADPIGRVFDFVAIGETVDRARDGAVSGSKRHHEYLGVWTEGH